MPKPVATPEALEWGVAGARLQDDKPQGVERANQRIIPAHPACLKVSCLSCLFDQSGGIELGKWNGCDMQFTRRLSVVIERHAEQFNTCKTGPPWTRAPGRKSPFQNIFFWARFKIKGLPWLAPMPTSVASAASDELIRFVVEGVKQGRSTGGKNAKISSSPSAILA